MHISRSERPFPRRLWLATVASIVAIVAVGIIVNHAQGRVGSPIAWRLAAVVIVTVLVAIAKFVGGPRAAAATGVVGVLIAVVLLIQIG